MPEYKRLTPELSVAPQLQVDDMATLARDGFHTVINNRPDGEGADQPASADLERAAREAGLAYHYQPVVPSEIDDNDARRFATLLREERGPVLAFCRTGNRCSKLWERSKTDRA